MAVPAYTPTTWNPDAAPGISAAQLQRNEDQIDAITTLLNRHHGLVSLRKNSNRSVPNVTADVQAWHLEDADDWGGHTTGSSNVGVEGAGIYAVTAMLDWDADADGYREMRIELVGGGQPLAMSRVQPLSGVSTIQTCSGIARLAASATLRVSVFHNAGNTLDILGGSNTVATQFVVARIGER